jgi:hypothetical protein
LYIDTQILPVSRTARRKIGRSILILRCDQCQIEFKKVYSKGLKERQQHYCSRSCLNESQRNGLCKKIKEEYFMKKYGVNNPYAAEEIKEKKLLIFKERYDVENPSQIPSIKQRKSTLMKKLCAETDITTKRKNTCIEKYGVKSFLETEECKNAYKSWSVQTYGTENPWESEKYRQEYKTAMIKHHGVDNPLKSKQIQEKVRKTMQEKYGVTCAYQLPKVKKRQKESLVRNAENLSSIAEDDFYKKLSSIFGKENIVRQWYVQDRHWLIDFYVRIIDTYIQFDGVYWHGLDRPIEKIRESTTLLDQNITKAYDRDREQDLWFLANGKKLVRITDVQAQTLSDSEISDLIAHQ